MESLPKAGVWESLQPSLNKDILTTLCKHGFKQMTPVQKVTIPLFLQNKDVCVEAVTGSGKTLAYLIPVIQILLRAATEHRQPWLPQHIGAIIISPTRELSKQIMEVLALFLEDIPTLKAYLLTGGTSQDTDTNEVEQITKHGCNVLVGTPGKLEHYITQFPPLLHLKRLEVLILDEADRLLDMGFEGTLNRILAKLPKQRRTGLFSATMNDQLSELARVGLRNPISVAVHVERQAMGDSQRTPSNLKVFYEICEMEDKLPRLIAFLDAHRSEKIIVYYATCACVDYFGKVLENLDIPAILFALHGKMEQKKRTAVFESFMRAPAGVLLCTDVAARGLDIPDVDWVVQIDPPQDPKSFIHRCGRTARLGKDGNALVFLLPKEDTFIEFLKLRKIPMKKMDADILMKVRTDSEEDGKVLCKKIQQLSILDRDMYEKGLRAFVSFLRAYQEHQCHFIFQVKDLDMGRCAVAFGLVHLPKMPELKRIKEIEHFEALSVDVSGIPYKDKVREKQRKARILKESKEIKEPRPAYRKKPLDAWSKQKERKDKKTDRRDKKDKKKDAIENKKKREQGDFDADDHDMMKDISLMNKRKKGKMTELEFEKAMGLGDDVRSV